VRTSRQERPLTSEDRAFFEPRFGWDFSRVRIRRDEGEADRRGAAAFTLGREESEADRAERSMSASGPVRTSRQERPLTSEDRAFFEPRFGWDFSRVRIRHDEGEADRRGAAAFTLGHRIALGRDADRSVLAHELAHVVQHDLGAPRMVRAKPKRKSAPEVLQGLLERPDLTLDDRQLHTRYDDITPWLAQPILASDHARLAANQLTILQELGDRALRAARTFKSTDITAMRNFFATTAHTREQEFQKLRSTTPASIDDWHVDKQAGENLHLSCIQVVRESLWKLFGDKAGLAIPKEPTENAMDPTMVRLRTGASRAAAAVEFHYLSQTGHRIRKGGGARPESLENSIWDWLVDATRDDPGWSVFGVSIMDGYHSVIVSVDGRKLGSPKIYMSDHTRHHGPDAFEEMDQAASGHEDEYQSTSKRGLDEYILYASKVYWDESGDKTKPESITRVYRILNKQPPSRPLRPHQ
jgi:hypothetical protein